MDLNKTLALYRRYLWESHNILWIYTNQVSKLFQSRDEYFARCQIATPSIDARAQRELDDLMIAATLSSESQVERDMWGWTIRLPLKPWGLFCGVEPEGVVCGKFSQLHADAAKDPVGAFSIQRVGQGAPVRQTSLIPRETSASYLVEQYFDESEQLPARIAIGEGEALMALSMPDAHWDVVKALSSKELFSLFHELSHSAESSEDASLAEDPSLSEAARSMKAKFHALRGPKLGTLYGDLKLMHEAVFYYGCRCDQSQMTNMIAHLPQAQRDALWDGVDHLDIECPRCGRSYRIERES